MENFTLRDLKIKLEARRHKKNPKNAAVIASIFNAIVICLLLSVLCFGFYMLTYTPKNSSYAFDSRKQLIIEEFTYF